MCVCVCVCIDNERGDTSSNNMPCNVDVDDNAEVDPTENCNENVPHSHLTSPNQCHQCGKCFSNKSGLKQHTRIHTNDKPHQHSFCAKTFLHKQQLVSPYKRRNRFNVNIAPSRLLTLVI